MLFVVAMFAATALVMITLSIPLIGERVPPNSLYGLRVPATFESEEVWYEANRRSGYDLFVLGIVILALTLLLPFAGLNETTVALGLSTIAIVGTLTMLVIGWRRANWIARAVRERDAHI